MNKASSAVTGHSTTFSLSNKLAEGFFCADKTTNPVIQLYPKTHLRGNKKESVQAMHKISELSFRVIITIDGTMPVRLQREKLKRNRR